MAIWPFRPFFCAQIHFVCKLRFAIKLVLAACGNAPPSCQQVQKEKLKQKGKPREKSTPLEFLGLPLPRRTPLV